MRRTNLVLDELVLKEVKRELGLKTYSETVNYALKEMLRLKKVEGLAAFYGTNLWEGKLSKMRADRLARKPRRRR
jgi:Arc/MetJ family transcription regulator